MEIIGKLEIQGGVVNFLHFHFFNVFTGSELVRILLVIGNSSSGDDGPAIESFTKLLPGIVEPSAQTTAAVIGMDKYVDPIQDITFRAEEHTSELQSLMRRSYAFFCLKKQQIQNNN